jgi:hypothetical protein
MRDYANPARFLKMPDRNRWLLAACCWSGRGRADAARPTICRVIQSHPLIHVPAAWLGMASGPRSRRPHQPARLAAPLRLSLAGNRSAGATFAALCLDRIDLGPSTAPGGNGTAA